MKILIVDDDKTSSKLLHGYLKMYGECHIAESGEEGLEAVKYAMQNNAPYELITLDIMMPITDGHEALRTIRELERSTLNVSGKAARIIMVSALDDISTVMKSFEELCDAYMAKPVIRKDLFNKLIELGIISVK
jgi:two-component system, chemotaxis family, chemotaxis protein CheY